MTARGVYAESSALLRWLLGHPEGDAIRAVLAAAPSVVTSRLTTVEVARTLQRLVASGMAPDRHAAAWAAFVHAARHWKIQAMSRDVLRRAGEGFPVEPVRTLDAIHLATALRYTQLVDAVEILSADDRIRRNAVALGMTVQP